MKHLLNILKPLLLIVNCTLLIVICTLLIFSCSSPQIETEVASPDGKIKVAFNVDNEGAMSYNVKVDDNIFIDDSQLGFEAKDGLNLKNSFEIVDVSFSSKDETWTQIWGENKTIRNHYNEMSVDMLNEDSIFLTMTFRVFDDGLGFRYEYKIPDVEKIYLTDELTSFNIKGDGTSWSIPADFDTYELLYRTLPLNEVKNANTPFTFKIESRKVAKSQGRKVTEPKSIYASIHEAALTDFPEMTLALRAGAGTGTGTGAGTGAGAGTGTGTGAGTGAGAGTGTGTGTGTGAGAGTGADFEEVAGSQGHKVAESESMSRSEFKAKLAPYPDGVKAKFENLKISKSQNLKNSQILKFSDSQILDFSGFKTPWRTIQIADKAVGLINSNLILNLNEPCALEGDLSWIRPMKYIGVWWSMHLGIESWVIDDRHGATTENAKRYIDFAANNNIDAVLFEGWNEGWETWGNPETQVGGCLTSLGSLFFCIIM